MNFLIEFIFNSKIILNIDAQYFFLVISSPGWLGGCLLGARSGLTGASFLTFEVQIPIIWVENFFITNRLVVFVTNKSRRN